jgi:hypothetical protein
VPLAIVVSVAVILAACALLFDGGGEERTAAPLRPDPLARIIDRVERERGLDFARAPDPIEVTPEQARREGVESLDQDYPPARRRADAELLVLLGLLPPGTDLGEAARRPTATASPATTTPARAGCGSSGVRRPPTACCTR